MAKKRNWKRSLSFSLIVALCAAVTFTLYPMIIFLINRQAEFWFTPADMMAPIAVVSAAAFAAVFAVLLLFSHRKCRIIQYVLAGALVSASLCYFIQSNYMIAYLPVLTGDEIDWNSFGIWDTASTVLWIAVPVLLLILLAVKRKLFRSVVTGLSAILVAMQVLTLGLTLATAGQGEAMDVNAYFSEEGLYELSEKGNVVTIISDTFEGSFMNDILTENPEYYDILKDFTYYDNATGTSCITYFSYAKLLTGVDFPLGKNSDDGMAHVFENQTLIDTVTKNGYDIAYYSTFMPTPSISSKVINYVDDRVLPDENAKAEIMGLLWKSTLFQGAPHSFKDDLIVLTKDYSDVQLSIAQMDKARPFVENDDNFRDGLLKNGLTAVDDDPRYLLYSQYGVHAPLSRNRNFEVVEFPEEWTRRDKQNEEAMAALKLLTEYVEELKKAGLYDQTTIIFTADHGYDMRFYPVLLVKEANGSSDRLQVNSVPFSFEEDYEKVLGYLTAGDSFSQAVEKLDLPEDRVRYVMNFRSKTAYGEETTMRSVIRIDGPARDENSYSVEEDEYLLDEAFAGKYALGSAMELAETAQDIAVYGLRFNGGLYSRCAVIDINFKEEIKEDLVFRTTATNQTEGEQTVKIYAGETEIGSAILGKYEAQEIVCPIDAELVKDNRLTLRVDAPDTDLLPGTSDTLGWSERVSYALSNASITKAEEQ